MLKLGTLFSGIGAIEQALVRLGIKYELVFVCDNGDIEIDIDYEQEKKNILAFKNKIEKKKYVDNLYLKNSKFLL